MPDTEQSLFQKIFSRLREWIWDILRGSVIGISNDIPGVSGGTMAVTMGIYDRIIFAVNNFRKDWRRSLKDLLPILLGVLVGIFAFARLLKLLIGEEGQVPPPLTLMPTIFAFIGLILGGLPIILRRVDFSRVNFLDAALFIFFAGLVIVLPLMQAGSDIELTPSFGNVLLLIPLGMLASATMVIPGVSGSMILLILGYYHSIINALHDFNMAVLIPYAVGLVVGIVFIARLMNFLLKKYERPTYMAILGLVVASPVALLYQNRACFDVATSANWLISIVFLVLGTWGAYLLSKMGKAEA